MTTKAGYYGSDAKKDRFLDAKTGETYFTLVNKTTGEVELYNEEFGVDKRVGTLGSDGKWEYNNNWWGGANKNDRAFAEQILKDGTLKDQASKIVQKQLFDEGQTKEEAEKKTKDLINKNQGLDEGNPSITVKEAQKFMNSGAGRAADGTREKGFGAYVFPKTLREGGGGQDFLKFDMMKYEPKDFDDEKFSFKDRSTDTDKRTIGSVILPIPGGIQDGQAVTWGGQTMTPLDMALANVALSGVTEGPGAMVSEAGNQAQKIAEGFEGNKKALAAVIAGMAAGGQQLLTRTTGAISNPNMELLFGGPSLRTFSFQFLLAPRDQDEAMTVIKILRFFKQGMAPIRTKSRLFMKSPHTFKLSYRNSTGEEHKYLNKFKECALQSLGVDYAPNGQYSTYEDGVMTAYQMTMTYSELNPIYNDDYGNEEFPAEIGF
tara:strand:- start:693 stop:1988 length:1296 start_codon:yes stop_codon:yes gene_type:complete